GCKYICRNENSESDRSLGKGEVDSSILSGSTSGDANESVAFSNFWRERSASERSREGQNDPATSAIGDTLVTPGNIFCSPSQTSRCSLLHHHMVGLMDCEVQCDSATLMTLRA